MVNHIVLRYTPFVNIHGTFMYISLLPCLNHVALSNDIFIPFVSFALRDIETPISVVFVAVLHGRLHKFHRLLDLEIDYSQNLKTLRSEQRPYSHY